MRQAIEGIQRRAESLSADAKSRLDDARARWHWFDHHVRAFERYQERRGDRLAAALTCYAFLSFFPLLALAYSLLGYLVGVSAQARDYFVRAVDSLLPGLAGDLRVEEIAQSKTAVGIIGLAALLITGQNWVQVLRESLRDIWGNEPTGGGNFFVKRLWDVGVLAFLGATLICGIAVSTVTTSATSTVLGWVGLQDVPGAGTGLRLLSIACAIAFNTVIFLALFTRLSGTRAPWRRIIRGALFGAAGFEVLKQVAALLVARVTENPVYGVFAVLVGLMVWINIASRFTLFVAAWTATRRVVLTADAADPENIADAETIAALTRDEQADESKDEPEDEPETGPAEEAEDEKAQAGKA
ncbi:YihY/virulence factor BrkB family protein [Actinomadura livida]|uniref:Membrane protein n=1 Tax=Actinomadura livida TaxID=79909 RepID=A0A7W7IJ89_9ACTN|nr:MULTISPECIES: YihY/virulence factor BrkB family protein [Actinomadura]MBB4778078.1 membrane protein [Actinomadura catellatispora]GGT96697.1 inner membrane protein YhjD [Actinomadura livida]